MSPTEWRISVYKRRIVLGGAVLALGIFAAGPAMASTITPGLGNAEAALLTSKVPGHVLSGLNNTSNATKIMQAGLQGIGSQVPGVPDLPALSDMSNMVQGSGLAGAVSGTAGNTTANAGLVPDASTVTKNLGGAQNLAQPNSGGLPVSGGLGSLGSAAGSVPALSTVTGAVHGLGIAGNGLPGLNNVTGLLGGTVSGGPLGG